MYIYISCTIHDLISITSCHKEVICLVCVNYKTVYVLKNLLCGPLHLLNYTQK